MHARVALVLPHSMRRRFGKPIRPRGDDGAPLGQSGALFERLARSSLAHR